MGGSTGRMGGGGEQASLISPVSSRRPHLASLISASPRHGVGTDARCGQRGTVWAPRHGVGTEARCGLCARGGVQVALLEKIAPLKPDGAEYAPLEAS